VDIFLLESFMTTCLVNFNGDCDLVWGGGGEVCATKIERDNLHVKGSACG
jgi:hypothetical protein